MSNFKLLAIRPRIGCHISLFKNLQVGKIYQFYSDITFLSHEDKTVDYQQNVACAIINNNVPEDFFAPIDKFGQNGIKINISAIAGKNGSGKSSLIDLFFAAVFVFSTHRKLLTPTIGDAKEKVLAIAQDIKALQNRQKELDKILVALRNSFNKSLETKENMMSFEIAEENLYQHLEHLKQVDDQIEAKVKEIIENKHKIREYEKLIQRTKVDIFFELDGKVYVLSVDREIPSGASIYPVPTFLKGQPINFDTPTEVEDINMENLSKHFFYTIAVNYSHYSLNSRYLGEWVRMLFHKNDGYRTPLVITPMRTEGNFNINSEMNFARTRLLNNVLIENKSLPDSEPGVFVTEHQYITKVYFTLNKEKIKDLPKFVSLSDVEWSGNERAVNLCRDLLGLAYYELWEADLGKFVLKDILLNYIVEKVDNITESYTEFQPGYIYNENPPTLDNRKFLMELLNDQTHVTYKLHQAINFLRIHLGITNYKKFSVSPKELKSRSAVRFEFTLSDLYRWMREPKDNVLIQHLPPSIFEVDFKLFNKKKVKSWFGTLSSGEQQFIHTIQGIVYHINNIQSAHTNDRRIKYRAINIILDEIELYFHPDFQRRFISRLLTTLYQLRLNKKSHIETINLLFLTHSPFILSDIPSNNVLRMEVKKVKGKAMPLEGKFETFAANIHDLLANSFFIEGTSMGAFAEQKVNFLIDKINNGNELTASDYKLVELIGDSFLKSSLKNLIERKKNDPNKI